MKDALIRASVLALAVAVSPAAFAACKECGTVTDLKVITQEGEGSGLGAVAGGVLGGVLGHQVGSGRGNTAATIAGAAGGAYVGHQVEKSKNTTTNYRVFVKMEEGNTRYWTFKNETAYKVGDKVKVVDGKLVRQ
jgi:outer membrane lipoprotein SlyB